MATFTPAKKKSNKQSEAGAIRPRFVCNMPELAMGGNLALNCKEKVKLTSRLAEEKLEKGRTLVGQFAGQVDFAYWYGSFESDAVEKTNNTAWVLASTRSALTDYSHLQP